MDGKQQLAINTTSTSSTILVGSASNRSGDTASFVLTESKDNDAQEEAIDSAVQNSQEIIEKPIIFRNTKNSKKLVQD